MFRLNCSRTDQGNGRDACFTKVYIQLWADINPLWFTQICNIMYEVNMKNILSYATTHLLLNLTHHLTIPKSRNKRNFSSLNTDVWAKCIHIGIWMEFCIYRIWLCSFNLLVDVKLLQGIITYFQSSIYALLLCYNV